MFDTEKMPYILGFFLTLLGWHVSQLTDEIRSTRAVAYQIEQQDQSGKITASIHNVSKTKPLTGVSFALACEEAKPCFVAGSEFLDVHPPNAISATEIRADKTVVAIKTNLAAGGRLQFGASPALIAPTPEFLFVPDETTPLDIYVFDGDTARGRFIEHYYDIVLISFLVLLVLTLIVAFFSVRKNRKI